jgi:hypothetical protein
MATPNSIGNTSYARALPLLRVPAARRYTAGYDCTVERDETYQTREGCKAALAWEVKLAPGVAATSGGSGGGEYVIFWKNRLVCWENNREVQ